MAKPKVLVVLGTSRQGSAGGDALLASGKFEVYATTRSAKSAEALKAKGVKCGPFTCGDAASAKAALDAAEPSLVFFTTLMGSRAAAGVCVGSRAGGLDSAIPVQKSSCQPALLQGSRG